MKIIEQTYTITDDDKQKMFKQIAPKIIRNCRRASDLSPVSMEDSIQGVEHFNGEEWRLCSELWTLRDDKMEFFGFKKNADETKTLSDMIKDLIYMFTTGTILKDFADMADENCQLVYRFPIDY